MTRKVYGMLCLPLDAGRAARAKPRAAELRPLRSNPANLTGAPTHGHERAACGPARAESHASRREARERMVGKSVPCMGNFPTAEATNRTHRGAARQNAPSEPKAVGRGDRWARVELNYRPHAYQACALTT